MATRDELLKKAESHLSRYQMAAPRAEIKDRETRKVAQLSYELSKSVEALLQAMKAELKD